MLTVQLVSGNLKKLHSPDSVYSDNPGQLDWNAGPLTIKRTRESESKEESRGSDEEETKRPLL